MSYKGMVEKIIPMYSYRLVSIWNIGILSRSILDGYLPNTLEYDGYVRGI